MKVTDNKPTWPSEIDHSSIQNGTSDPKSISLDCVRVQTNEEITVAIKIVWSLKHVQTPNRVTTMREARKTARDNTHTLVLHLHEKKTEVVQESEEA